MPQGQKTRVRRTQPLSRGDSEEIPVVEPKAHCKATTWTERAEEPVGEIEIDSEEEEEDEMMGSESADSYSSEDEEELLEDSIKNELSTLSFTELQQLQNQVGLKAFNQMLHKAPAATQTTSSLGKAASQTTLSPGKAARKRTNKNRPLEMSAKQRVPFLRKVAPVKTQRARDPRFDDLSGEYKPVIFEKTYAFLDIMKKEEKEMVKKQLSKVQDLNRKQELEQLLQRMNNQEEAQKSRRLERERHLQFKRQQRERVRQGSKPYHLTKAAQREMNLAEKYQELKRSGKLESFLGKKRKRNAGKDRRRMPAKKPA